MPEAVNMLIEQIPKTLQHAIEVEEGVPMKCVTNLEEVVEQVKSQLMALKVSVHTIYMTTVVFIIVFRSNQ